MIESHARKVYASMANSSGRNSLRFRRRVEADSVALKSDAAMFQSLDQLGRNLWWTWNPDARNLFESIDPVLWRASGHNPIATLAGLSASRREVLARSHEFQRALAHVEAALGEYQRVQKWFERSTRGRQKKLHVAYFCMEYGIHESLPLYAGGLGILAGDHVKSASDLGVPLTAIGILWRKGYYRQELASDGATRVVYAAADFPSLPVEDTRKTISIPIGTSKVKARIWKLTVGRVPVYLLDTDISANSPRDRALTHHLYRAGDPEYRVRQEVLLGVGGLVALDALGLKPTVFHLNEGHAAFCPLERVRRLMAKGASYAEAVTKVQDSSVFTTHTPVPEGNDRFDPKLISRFFPGMAKSLGLTQSQFLALGREDESDLREPFCMTVLALKLCERCNGVAELHGDTSRRMWMKTFGAASPEEVPIRYVTNGIHTESWLADEARPFYDKWLKPHWLGAGPSDDWWRAAGRIPPRELWALRQTLRKKMIAELRIRLREQMIAGHDSADRFADLYDALDENALTIGFARRFATYKRAPLIFHDLKRLARLVGNSNRPVQLIFAGKAHPADAAGQEFVRAIHEFGRQKPFRGRVHLVHNYDMHIGRLLTQGCDVWLNNPVRPMEASGTSGMKPVLNGGLNCSILDGWWPEAFNGKNGWAIGGKQFADRRKQDQFDAKAILDTLEKQVVPLFYKRNRSGIPTGWVKMMAESMKSISCQFSSHRMLAEYVRDSYLPSHS